MKAIVMGVAFVAALIPLPGCASNLTMKEALRSSELERILIKEGIEHVSSVEQQAQDDGTVILLVASNRRKTGFSGCIVDQTDIELRRSEQDWVVNSRSDVSLISLVPCSEAGNTGFASIEGNVSPEDLDQSVRYLRRLLRGSLSPNLISGSSELEGSIKSVDIHDLQSVFVHENGDIEFQIVSKAILPRLLGVRVSMKGGHLERIHLNADNSVEIVTPYQP